MIEKNRLLQAVDSIATSLKVGLSESPNVTAVAFYGNPPTAEGDLDLLIVVEDEGNNELNHLLQTESNRHKLTIDAWVLSPDALELRMKRIAGTMPRKPNIIRETSSWDGFTFVPVVGSGFIESTIERCYTNPEAGGPIPPTPEEKRVFHPSS
ncbi:hypothetical protein ACFL0F_02285 [Patescibacteria group bacterium]